MPDILHVLIADGDTDTADTLAECALSLGHSVQVAYDSGTAIALMRALHFDVAFVDIASFGAEGAAFCRLPTAHPTFQYTCMIAMTDVTQPNHATFDWCD